MCVTLALYATFNSSMPKATQCKTDAARNYTFAAAAATGITHATLPDCDERNYVKTLCEMLENHSENALRTD